MGNGDDVTLSMTQSKVLFDGVAMIAVTEVIDLQMSPLGIDRHGMYADPMEAPPRTLLIFSDK